MNLYFEFFIQSLYLTKSIAGLWGCDEGECGEGEGDCDHDSQCKRGLICDNGRGWDTCEKGNHCSAPKT